MHNRHICRHPLGCGGQDQQSPRDWPSSLSAISIGAVIGVPLTDISTTNTWLDWSLFGLLYVVSGLGITVGYHRLMALGALTAELGQVHILIGGVWALQNSAIKWGR